MGQILELVTQVHLTPHHGHGNNKVIDFVGLRIGNGHNIEWTEPQRQVIGIFGPVSERQMKYDMHVATPQHTRASIVLVKPAHVSSCERLDSMNA